MTIYGYARVSTQDQTLEAQKEALLYAGADALYTEKVSGVQRARPQLDAMLSHLQLGDVVLVTRMDRLARSTLDMLNLAQAITDKGAAFKSLAEPWADTTSPAGKMILTVMAGIAEFERSLILQRTSEGRSRAQAQGVKFGRPLALTPKQAAEALRLSQARGNRYAAEVLGVSVATIERVRTRSLREISSLPTA